GCLVKDLETRLQIVSWNDFELVGSPDRLARLRSRLERRDAGSLDASAAALASRLRYDRTTFEKGFVEAVKLQLIETCGPRLPLIVKAPTPGGERTFGFEFMYSERVKITGSVRIRWQAEMYARTATITLGDVPICEVTISEAEEQAVYSASCALADVVAEGLDLLESNFSLADIAGTTAVAGNRGQ